MISRLSTFAAVFAIVATGTVTYAAGARPSTVAASTFAAAKAVRIVQLERVVVVARRDASAR